MQKRELLLDKMLDGIIAEELFQTKDKKLKEQYDVIAKEIASIEHVEKEKESNTKRILEIVDEIKDINDRALIVSKLSEHINSITIYPDHGIVCLDFWDDMRFNIKRVNYRKIEINI